MAKQTIAPPSFWTPIVKTAWEHAEPALRFDWVRLGFDWARACPAMRLGFSAAMYWRGLDMWTADLEARLEREWLRCGARMGWSHVRAIVRHGWEEGRRQLKGGVHVENEALVGHAA